MSIEKRVKEVISKVLNLEEDTIVNTLSTGDVEQWDSVGNLNLIEELQKEFDVQIPFEDLFDLTTVQDFINEIKKLKNE